MYLSLSGSCWHQVSLQVFDRPETAQANSSHCILRFQYSDMYRKGTDICAHHYHLLP